MSFISVRSIGKCGRKGLGVGETWTEDRKGRERGPSGTQGGYNRPPLCSQHKTATKQAINVVFCVVYGILAISLSLIELPFLFAFLNEETEANETGYSVPDTQ